jgi:hypothetical protein
LEEVLVVADSPVERAELRPLDAVTEPEVLDSVVDGLKESEVPEPVRVEDAEPEKLAMLDTDVVAVDETSVEASELRTVDAVNDPELLDPERVEDAEPETLVVLDTEAAVVDPPVLVKVKLNPLELPEADWERASELPVDEPELATVVLVEEDDDAPAKTELMGVTTGLPVPVPARGRVMAL